jgi:hypothetical protein
MRNDLVDDFDNRFELVEIDYVVDKEVYAVRIAWDEESICESAVCS